ncbi:MAG TPA: cysteine--tRNA ligase [Acidimicrobiales bacterium]|jgi:cysteinyl-tRNA synthetase|nr:cysteine--tRNA ligase [Acidimicrobiales bacterium]
MLRLFDTAKGGVVPFEPREPGKVSMYVCGPTVYGPPHVGHGRFALAFDVLRRYLAWAGNDVTYVSNITDIDDRIIDRAQREERDWRQIAERCESVWYRAMDALGIQRPDHDPHATAYVDGMVELVERLVAQGVAYETSDGVYFQAERVDDYGLLARQPLDSLRAGARVEADEEKRSPIDFALWKKAKPGEPTWPSPWGPGRPGWHTECVVMSLDLLGEGFDIHGGAQDLVFPHHENERAQAVADGRRFARHWVHNGFVEVEGIKMSKSLGNVTNLLDLVEQYDPRAYRLLVLQSHYRSPIDVTDDSLRDAIRSLDRLDTFARKAAALDGGAEPDAAALARFREAMEDDLDTPRATAAVFDLVRRANALLATGDHAAAAPLAAAVREITGALGLELRTASGEVPAEILDLGRRRDEARSAKDWATADALRAQIVAAGYVVEDTPAGTEIRPS